MKNIIFILALLTAFSVASQAQGVRDPKPSAQTNKTEQTNSQQPKPAPAPKTFNAKYEGGLFGFSETIKGTLNFDDMNERLVFRNKENKEVFALPYKSLLVIYPDSRSYRPTAATVGSVIPLPGAGLLGLIRAKNPYLVMQFDDPDSDAKGTTSFKLDNKELLRSVIYTLGEKAALKQRGDAFYRPRANETKPI